MIRDVLAGKPVDLPISESIVRDSPAWDRGDPHDDEDVNALVQVVLHSVSSRYPAVRDEAERGRIVAGGITLDGTRSMLSGVMEQTFRYRPLWQEVEREVAVLHPARPCGRSRHAACAY